ncbi:MAG TPA: site-specific DNA-methyltransferase [Methylomirabilota bacterium]|nr:site-specific DNA-methyltransferase [Methylomirabilota bacterium]
MTRKQKLELTWIGKERRPRLEPRILLEDPEKSYHAPHRVTDHDIFDNRLIFGDNLLALKALEQEFSGKIKCIYIDPPYNTGSAFEHYDDSLAHSLWLSFMKPRLELLWKLLCSDGLLAVQIDDNEFARLFLLMTEVCGERNLKVVVVKMAEPTGVKMTQVIKTGGIPKLKEYVILAGKSGIRGLNIERMPKGTWDDEYRLVLGNTNREELLELKSIIEDEHRSIADLQRADDICAKFTFETVDEVCRRETGGKVSETWLQDNAWRIVRTVATTDGAKRLADKKRGLVEPDAGAFVIETPQKKAYMIKTDYNPDSAQPRLRLLFADDYLTVHPGDFWQDIKTTGLGDEGGVNFTNGKKPEALIKRIIGMSTQPGDLVLDSFAGSGTTGAVAHKMGRRWIMVELGEHCHTHIIPRLKKVINGADQGGITKAVGWQGGGGFRYFRLAPSLLEKDKWGRWVINKTYNAEMLAEAVCKLEGFTYAPSDSVYWQHGHSTERDFIYVTTQNLSHEQLQQLSDEVGENRSLLVMCSAFRARADRYPNLTIKKIPAAVLSRCEWGRDDYSLKIENLPKAPPKSEQLELGFEGGDKNAKGYRRLAKIPLAPRFIKGGKRSARPPLAKGYLSLFF